MAARLSTSVQLENHVRAVIAAMAMQKATPLVVAVSGGSDSMALASVLAKCFGTQNIHAVLVDHQLRSESSHEAAKVKDTLRDLGVDCSICTLKWGPREKKTQEVARLKRYHALMEEASRLGSSIIATGHHADDVVETMFQRMARKTSVNGLAAMKDVQPMYHPRCFSPFYIVRPFLQIRKFDLQHYCQVGCTPWVEDPSNQDTSKYTRNAVRQGLYFLNRGFGLSNGVTSAGGLSRTVTRRDGGGEQHWVHNLEAVSQKSAKMPVEGCSVDRILALSQYVTRIVSDWEDHVHDIVANHAWLHPSGACCVDGTAFGDGSVLHPQLQHGVARSLLMHASWRGAAPSEAAIGALLDWLGSSKKDVLQPLCVHGVDVRLANMNTMKRRNSLVAAALLDAPFLFEKEVVVFQPQHVQRRHRMLYETVFTCARQETILHGMACPGIWWRDRLWLQPVACDGYGLVLKPDDGKNQCHRRRVPGCFLTPTTFPAGMLWDDDGRYLPFFQETPSARTAFACTWRRHSRFNTY